MTKNFEKGTIVKFVNSNGIMDGGTIISIIKEADGTEYAAINTLEGANLKIKIANLIPIKHQRKGVVSDKFKKRIAKEIAEHNQALQVTPYRWTIGRNSENREGERFNTSTVGDKTSQRPSCGFKKRERKVA